MRIVLKFGTGILTRTASNLIDRDQIKRLAGDVASVAHDGHECVIVSSGAVGAGLRELGLKQRPVDLATIQACAAVGQSKLMHIYETMFAEHDLSVAQLLLTHGDLDSRTRYRNARNTLTRLLDTHHIVPIINENDSVATEELKFGDNDRLSAEVAILANADLLVLFTSVDGLANPQGERLSVVENVESVVSFARPDKGDLSVGGMVSKLQAVKLAVSSGIETVIASGRQPGAIGDVLVGADVGTRFLAASIAASVTPTHSWT